jgi:hypothetical protein
VVINWRVLKLEKARTRARLQKNKQKIQIHSTEVDEESRKNKSRLV